MAKIARGQYNERTLRRFALLLFLCAIVACNKPRNSLAERLSVLKGLQPVGAGKVSLRSGVVNTADYIVYRADQEVAVSVSKDLNSGESWSSAERDGAVTFKNADRGEVVVIRSVSSRPGKPRTSIELLAPARQ
jgi:hypothetical protein